MSRTILPLLLAVVAIPPLYAADKRRTPFGKVELLCLFESEPYEKPAVNAVAKRGISFQPDDTYLQMLARAGASEDFMKGVRNARIIKPSKPSEAPPTGNPATEELVLLHIARAAQIRFEKLRPVGAEAEYRAALILDPENAYIHLDFGSLWRWFRPNQLENELAEYREATRLNPDMAEAHEGLAGALLPRGDLSEAESECRTAMRLEPDRASPHRWLQSILEKKGDKPGANAEKQLAEKLGVDEGAPKRIRMGGLVAMSKLDFQPKVIYPPEAKKDGIQGAVLLDVLIGRDGAVKDVELVSGDPMLAAAATGAVAQWRYKPTTVNRIPVEVMTQVQVNFQLP
ncbi:MAG: TonB family protein [Acidobacteriia bacterium]|nr:TonB family protein [Terriglobia bacterium]